MSLHVYADLIQGSDERVARRFMKFASTDAPDQCWEWTSTRNRSGYGKFWLAGRTAIAHRVSYELHKGPIPPGVHVRHTCDNPPCVNPHHLLLGTPIDNARDALDRGRYRRGERNGRAKLTPEQVDEIRAGRRLGETQVSLARRYGVSRSAVQWILNGRTWGGIGGAQ